KLDTLHSPRTQAAVDFIKANRDQPFFIYLAHTMPHVPLFASPEFEETSQRGPYGDVVEEIDSGVGRILETLAELELDERTLVIFTSDNGPWHLDRGRGGSAGPLRGYKFQTYEGGVRVPCIMRWPETISAGTECHEVAASIDLLPTLAGIGHGKLPNDHDIDGRDIRSLMANEPGAKSPHEALFYFTDRGLEAVRSGPWKLRRAPSTRLERDSERVFESDRLRRDHSDLLQTLQAAIAGRHLERAEDVIKRVLDEEKLGWEDRLAMLRLVDLMSHTEEIELFNLQQDVSEQWNIAEEHPDIVARLSNVMDEFQRELDANRRPPLRVPTE
ncbi:MAG: sulfatase-like hydrolase/transferase, partial [Planctomycetota bacterium]